MTSYGTEVLNFSLSEASLFNKSTLSEVCTFQQIKSLWDIITLFEQIACYRHSTGYTIFLCLANLVILVFGLVGNSLVIYVVLLKINTKIASSIFILNLAVADLLVILFCIPATLVANLFMPWVIGNAMCKAVAYGQGVSVFSSVYSLVAITFDRFRAIHHSLGLTPNMSVLQAKKIVLLIWILGLLITFPWVSVFEVVYLNPYKHDKLHNDFLAHISLPFCQEIWNSESQENWYFLIVHVFACFLLPLCMITVCNIVIWRNMLSTTDGPSTSAASSMASSSFPTSSRTCLQKSQRDRKIRLLKMFTGLTFGFFICWLPLYGIMARVKFFYTDDYRGSALEQQLVPELIPAAQLLGSCNSCVNPVLYALLNQKFRESFKLIFKCTWCSSGTTHSDLGTPGQEYNSVAVIVAAPAQVGRIENSAV